MSERRQVWATLANLLQRLERAVDGSPSVNGNAISGLEQEVRKLGKTQYKANALAEERSSQLEKALAAAQAAQEQQARLLEALANERAAEARQELLAAVLPALDGLENAMSSGRRYLEKRDLAAQKPDLTPAQAALVSPADRAMLAGWLDGLRLVRERLLAILAEGNVTPIPTVGLPFDPYQHVAVGTAAEIPAEVLAQPGVEPAPGLVVAEERAGYRSPAGVLRYAEVVVYRPTP